MSEPKQQMTAKEKSESVVVMTELEMSEPKQQMTAKEKSESRGRITAGRASELKCFDNIEVEKRTPKGMLAQGPERS
jgi:hypothetical protein